MSTDFRIEVLTAMHHLVRFTKKFFSLLLPEHLTLVGSILLACPNECEGSPVLRGPILLHCCKHSLA